MEPVPVLRIVNLIVALSLTLHHTYGSSSCASFHTKTTHVINSQGCNATLTFSVDNRCPDPDNDVSYVKVFKGKSSLAPPECVVELRNNKCKSPAGCQCDNQLGDFSITRQLQECEPWLIVGELRKSGGFNTTVYMHLYDSTASYYTSQPATETTNADSTESSYTSKSVTKTANPVATSTRQEEDKTIYDNLRLVIILGSIGCVLLLLVPLSIVFHAIARKKRTRDSRIIACSSTLALDGHRRYVCLHQNELPKAQYHGSNASLMITNDLYGGAPSTPAIGPSGRDGSRDRTPLQPAAFWKSNGNVSVGVNVDQREKMLLPSAAVVADVDSEDAADASREWVSAGIREKMPLPEIPDVDRTTLALSVCEEEGDYAEINDLAEGKDKEKADSTHEE